MSYSQSRTARRRRRAANLLALALVGTAVVLPTPAHAGEHLKPRGGKLVGAPRDLDGSVRVRVRHGEITRFRLKADLPLLDPASSESCLMDGHLDTKGYQRSGQVRRDGTFTLRFRRTWASSTASDGTGTGTGTTTAPGTASVVDTIRVHGRFTDRMNLRATLDRVLDSRAADGMDTSCASIRVRVHAVHRRGVAWPFPAGPRSVHCARLKCVALTFDDGPGRHTSRLLRALRREHARATFFPVGEMVADRPGALRSVARAGHEIGNHTWSHPYLPGVSDRTVRHQVRQSARQIEEVVGERPALVRPPYGGLDSAVRDVLRDLGAPIVLWSVDSLDWRYRDARAVADRVVRNVRPGSVVLLHDIHASTVAAVPRILRELSRRGYVFVTVSELYREKLRPGRVYHGREGQHRHR